MKEEKFCSFCPRPLNEEIHGNRRYCDDDDCYKKQKKIRGKKKYWDQKSKLDGIKKVDSVLKIFHGHYGSTEYAPANLLEAAGMDWSICQKEIQINGGAAILIDKFAYTLYENQTVKIWKL